MNIEKLTITQDEVNMAVQEFLKEVGINMRVTSIKKRYTYSDEYEVEVEPFSKKTEPEPSIEAVEDTLEVIKDAALMAEKLNTIQQPPSAE